MAFGIAALIIAALVVAFFVLGLMIKGYVGFFLIWSRTRSMARGGNPPYESDVKLLKLVAGTGVSLGFAMILPTAALALVTLIFSQGDAVAAFISSQGDEVTEVFAGALYTLSQLFSGNAVPSGPQFAFFSMLALIVMALTATGWVIGRKFYISMSMVVAVIPLALIIGVGVIVLNALF